MAITSGSQYRVAAKQEILFHKTGLMVGVNANQRGDLRIADGLLKATSMVATSASSGGQVLTDASDGFPEIRDFGVGNTGYLTRVRWNHGTVAGRFEIFDYLWAGNVSCTTLATTTVVGAASYLGRDPSGSGVGLRLLVAVAADHNSQATTVSCTYTNQAGTGSRTSTTSQSLAVANAGQVFELGLQAGDTGIRSVDTVTVGGIVNTRAGASVNIVVARLLYRATAYADVSLANNYTGDDGLDLTGAPVVYQDSALATLVTGINTSPLPSYCCYPEITNA